MMIGRRGYLDQLVRASVVVHTVEGRSIAGVLGGCYRDCLALTHASVLVERGENVEFEGEVVIPRAQVAFVQLER